MVFNGVFLNKTQEVEEALNPHASINKILSMLVHVLGTILPVVLIILLTYLGYFTSHIFIVVPNSFFNMSSRASESKVNPPL